MMAFPLSGPAGACLAYGPATPRRLMFWPWIRSMLYRLAKVACRWLRAIRSTFKGTGDRQLLAALAAIRYGTLTWMIWETTLFRQDRPQHGLIEPKHALTLAEFQAALAQTRSRWKLHCR